MSFGEQGSPSWPATQDPVAGSHFCGQVPTVNPQFFGVPAQVPAPSQTSSVVQALPSSQGVPFGLGVGCVHLPVAGSHVGWFQQPARSSTGWQMVGVPVHTPPTQWSSVVQALLSLHGVPKSAGGLPH